MSDKITTQLQANGALPSINPMVPSSGKFDYQPVEDFLIPPNSAEFSELMSPEYKAMLDRHASQINAYAPPAVGNLRSPYPTLATDTYSPFDQKHGLDLSTPEGKIALLSTAPKITPPSGEVKIADPIYAGIRSHNFDRYYKHPEFSNLGWHPYANNEETYNANSTWWDDSSRMVGQWANLAGTGFLSAYRSWGDLFDSDDYFTGRDLESAREFSDAMRIGNSTRGGFSQFANNLILQSAYTMGVIGSIAAEELALWGAAAAQGGLNPASDAAAATRTAFNFKRLVGTVANSFSLGRLGNATRNMYRSFRSVDTAKDFYTGIKAGGRFLAKGIAPETYQAIRTLNSTRNGVQNLSNMAKVSKTFGGFYRDVRSLNLALAESKMEGGMVYDQQIANGYALQTQLNKGEPITPEQMQNITDKAARASYYTTLLNAPTIYLSNQFVLGNAFGAYNRTLSRVLGDQVKGVGARVLKTKGVRDAAGKIVTRPFEYVGDGLKGYLKTVQAAGVSGSFKMAGQASLRYFSQNLSEGLQEVAQEAIAKGTKDYHQAILNDPSAGGFDLLNGTISSAVSSQFGAQGFETFMSGFLMGGVVQGPQKLFFQGVPALYERTVNKEKFEEYKKNKQEFIDSLVNSVNDIYEVTAQNPLESIFDTNKNNLTIQKQASVDMLQAAFDQSNFDFVDAKDFSKFQAIYTVLSNNKVGEFREQFKDYLNLTDEELSEAFPSFKSDIKSGKLRTRLQDMINKVDELEESYEVNKDKFRNPFDASVYKYGSREWNNEKIREMSFEHARYLYMFTEDGFKRAVERSQKIYSELSSDPIIDKMAASDITVLLDENSIQKEIATLLAETATLDPKTNKDIIDAKVSKLEGLSGILKVLYADENITSSGNFDRIKIGKLRSAFQNYVQKLAKTNQTFVNQDKIDEALKKIVDYSELKSRAVAYNKSIEYMNNPERFVEIQQRSEEFYKNVYKNRFEIFKNSVKSYIGKVEINQLLNELAKIEVYPDPKQVKEFMESGNIDVLQDFFTEKGVVNQVSDKDIYDQIQALVSIYKSAVTPEVTAQTPQEKEEGKGKQKRKKEVAEILDEAEIDEDTPSVELFGTNSKSNPVIKKILDEKYKEYASDQLNIGEKPLDMNDWLNTDEAQKYVTAYKSLKSLWYQDLKKLNLDAKVLEKTFSEDKGFEDWLKNQKTNDLVRKIFNSTETNFSDFIEVEPNFETGEFEERDFAERKSTYKVVDDSFNTVQIVESKAIVPDSESGLPVAVTLYSVRDKKGKIISEAKTNLAGVAPGAAFDNIKKAREAAKKLDEATPDTTQFTFGGMQVSYGSTVIDKDGNKYMVIGTPADVEKGKKLFLLPFESIEEGQSKRDRHALSKKVTELEFKEGYKTDSFNFTRVPKDASRILINEPVEVYPFENGFGTSVAEGALIANARLQKIFENLTAEERASIVFVIKRNQTPGKSTGRKFQTKDQNGILRDPNPYINMVREPFAVGIAFGNDSTRQRINKILIDNNIQIADNADGVFAYVRTGSLEFVNDAGEIVNPLNLTKDIVENTFIIYPNQEESALSNIEQNFAIQQAFVNAVSDKMEGVDQATFSLNDFPEFSFNLSSFPSIQTSPKSISELNYNKVDGVSVIVINDRLKDGTTSTRYLVDIEDVDEREAFIDNMLEELSAQPVVLNAIQSQQRYMAVIKLPNGIYTAAPLKTPRLTDDKIFELGRELIAEGIRTINENLDSGVKPVSTDAKADIEKQKQAYRKMTKGTPINKDAPGGTKVGDKYDDRLNIIVVNESLADNFDPKLADNNGEGYKVISKIKEYGEKENGVQTKAPKVEIIIFNNKADADRFFAEEKVKLDKYIADAEQAASESKGGKKGNVIPLEDREIKDKNFNVEFNKAFNKKFFITTNIEGYTVEINVNADGGFRAELYSKEGKAVIGTAYAGGRQQTLDYEGEQKPDIIQTLLNTLQEQGINKGKANAEKEKKQNPNYTIPEWVNIKLSINNVRGSFTEDADINTIIDNTVTTLDENVRTNYKLRLNADAIAIEEAKLFNVTTNTSSVFTPSEVFTDDSGESLETSEEAYDSVLDMSDKVFEEFAKADFKELPLEMKQQIANKIARGEKLSEREEKIVKNGISGPTIQVMVGKIQRDNNINPDIQTLKKELEINRTRIRAIEEEIDTNEPDMIKALTLIEENEERSNLIARNREIENKLMANKIISEELTEQDITDIDEFIQWANDNLPDFITIEDISNLRDNLVTNGIRVGAFALYMSDIAGGMTIKGTIYTGAKSPFKYHEAFHGVFRSLLTNSQQDKLYNIAKVELKNKYGDKYEEELEKFRNSANQYKEMSRARLEKEFFEEYMADEYEKFKKDPRSTKTNSVIKNFFNRIIEIIKSLFGIYSPYELQNLFRQIDSGKFKSASPINNRFTDSLANGITVANKIIPIETIESETGTFGYKALDNELARSIVSAISARVIRLEQENKNANFNLKKAVNDSFLLYKGLYNTKRTAYQSIVLNPQQRRNLRDLEKAFKDYGDFIKDNVYETLRFYDIKSRKIEEDLDEIEEQVGDRLRTTDQYDKDVTSIGGFSSLSSFLRKYIGTTPLTEKDQFGNDYLIDPDLDENGNPIEGTGEKIMITVDFATAYNGFLKAVKNLNDPIKILQQLYFFSINNPQTKAVVDRLFADLGIQWEGQLENGELPAYSKEVIEKFKAGEPVTIEERNQGIKKPLLLQAVLKGFENARVDYLFIHTTKGDKVLSYTAANRDDAHTQVDRWGQAYIQKARSLKNNADARKIISKTLEKLLNRLQFVSDETSSVSQRSLTTMTDKALKDFSEDASKKMEEYLGISISPKFIEFSISKNIEKPTRYQKALINANSNEKTLTYQDIREIKKIIDSNQNLFSETDEGAKNRLRRIALGNAAFDENVGASVFKNPNGDLVYAHQLPSFHLKQIEALNDPANNGAKIDELKVSDDYLLNNFLLNSEAFKQLSSEGRLRVLRIAGSKIGDVDLDDNGLVSESSGRTPTTGKTYGDSTPREFILNLINSYTYAIDPLTGKMAGVSWTNEDGTINTSAIAPVLIRVLEASNTGDMIALPVIKAVEESSEGKTVLTEEALNSFVNNIAAEFERIQRESDPQTATLELHVGYNAIAISNESTGTEEIIPVNVNSSNVNKARAFNFHKTGVLLSPLGSKKESRQGTVTIQTSDFKLKRIESGDQTSVIYDQKTAEQIIGFRSAGVVRDAIIKTKEGEKSLPKMIIGRGMVKVNAQNREEIFESLKGSIARTKSDQFKYEVKIGNKKFYVESINEQKFLQGRKAMYMYDIMDAAEYNLKDETAAMIGGFDVAGYLTKLTNAARSPEFAGLSFTESLNKLKISESELKRFLEYRLNQEFNEFNTALDEMLTDEVGLASFITTGIQTGSGAITAETRRSARLLNIVENNQDYNLRQIFFNDYINTTAINQILLGDTAYSLKDAVDEIKRAKSQAASYYSAASTVAAPEYGIYKPLQEFSIFETTEPIVKSTHNEGSIKNADAQLWMTTKAFRYFQYGFGKLSPAQAELFDRVERGDDISPEDIFGTEESSGYAKRQEMLNSQKLVYADGKTFVKMSAFPLLPQFTSIKDKNGEYTIPKKNKVALHNLRIKLEAFERENDTVAVSAPRSALKMLQKNVSNIHSVTANTNSLNKDQSVTLNANFLGLQVINPSNKTVITDPTQIKTLVTSEQNDATEVLLNGEKTTVGAIRKAYHTATRNRGNLNYINKRNLVFSFDVEYAQDQLYKSIKEGAITADLYTYLRYAEASLGSTGSSSHLMELFSLDDDGNQKYNLNNPLTYDKFMNLFMSYFSKSVFSEKVPGATVSLVSDFGVRIFRRVLSVDENGMPDKHEIITEAQYEAMANKPDILFNIDEGSYPGNDDNLIGLADEVKKSKGKGVVIIDRLRNDLKEYNSKGVYTGQKYGEMLLPAHHKEVMSEVQLKGKSISDVFGKMFAVRIPSQDNHSTYNVKWVDFMPAVYGSSGIFARELIEISGADFDIDKLYIQFKEFYEKNGEFYEYGKGKNEKEQFQDYVNYVNEKVKDSDSIYGEALYKFNGRGTTNPLTSKQMIGARSQGFSEDAINALSVLGMPRFYAEYSTYRKKFGHEPYSAAINNDILDYKFALMGNQYVTERKPLYLDKNGNATTVNTGKPFLNEDGVQKTGVPISYESADLVVLQDLWDELKEELPELAELSEEEGIDVDNLFGKLRMFANNKEGSRSIGAVVLPNLYLNLLQEYNVKIESLILNESEVLPQIKFDGITYNEFNNTYEILEGGGQGQRTQYILSALITAATDNAKERLLAKLGLNINALSVVANLTALGVPIKTSILLINHPVIRQAYFEEANDGDRATTIVLERIKDLQKVFLEEDEKSKNISVNQDVLKDAIESPLIKATATLLDLQEIRDSGEVDKLDVIQEISILRQFIIAADLANTTRYMGDLLNLSGGLGQGLDAIDKRYTAIEKLGLNLTDKEYAALGINKPMVNVRPIFRGNTWQAGYLERFEEFSNILLPKVVLSVNPLFRTITREIIYQTDAYRLKGPRGEKTRNNIVKDLLSFLTIKAYQHNALVNNPQSVATLSNGLIYNQVDGEKITNIVERLRTVVSGDNYFLDSFIIAEKASDEGNKTGLNIAGANTFLRYNDSQKLDIQNGFMTLYADPLTRSDAMAIVHYMMVKDGLQYGFKSIVEAVAPIALSRYLNQIDTVQAAMERPNDTIFQSTFGSSLDQLIVDYIQGYLTSSPNAYLLKKVRAATYSPESRGINVESKLFTKALAQSNPDILYVFGDNASKQGSVGNSSIRNEANSFGLIFKKDLGRGQSSYYGDNEVGEFVEMFDKQVEDILNMIADGKIVTFPKELISEVEIKEFKKNSSIVYEYMRAKLKEDFKYDIDKKAKKTKVEKEELKTANPAILSQPVYVDASGLVSKLVVDLYKGIVRIDRKQSASAQRSLLQRNKMSKQSFDRFVSNIRALRKSGFTKFIETKKESDFFTEVEFPMVIRQNVGTDFAPAYKYYILAQTQSLFPGTTVINRNNKAVGSYAEYIEVDIKGSMAQNPIGFMFGERPSIKEIRNYINSVNSSDILDRIDDMDFDVLDKMDMTKGVSLPSNATVEATEKGITVNGKNISKITSESEEQSVLDEKANISEPDIDDADSYEFGDVANSFDITANSFFNDLLADNEAPENKYPELTTWWDENIDDPNSVEASKNRNKLKENRANPEMKFNISTLEDFIKMYEETQFASEQEFIDHFNNCYL